MAGVGLATGELAQDPGDGNAERSGQQQQNEIHRVSSM
jgi:hypothetical protein